MTIRPMTTDAQRKRIAGLRICARQSQVIENKYRVHGWAALPAPVRDLWIPGTTAPHFHERLRALPSCIKVQIVTIPDSATDNCDSRSPTVCSNPHISNENDARPPPQVRACGATKQNH